MNRSLYLCFVLLVFAGALPAADVSFYGIAKEQQFVQPTQGPPALAASNAFGFIAFVITSTNGAVTNATVRPPGGTNRTLAAEGDSFQFNDFFNTQAALDTAYPNGSIFSPYTLTMYTVND